MILLSEQREGLETRSLDRDRCRGGCVALGDMGHDSVGWGRRWLVVKEHGLGGSACRSSPTWEE